MMSPIISLVAVLCVASSAISYPTSVKKYSYCIDPTYACQDIETARLCDVVSSCINDIWSTMNAPDDNDDICTICKEMVKEARDQLLSNMTQEEIKEVFEGSCKLLPVTLIADACIKLVDEFIPQLVEMLASRMDPNMVCTVSGLCNLAHIPIKTTSSNTKDTLTCQFCTHVLDHVKDLITTNTTEEEFRTALQNFCKHTGSFSSKCAEYVNKYFDEIFGFIKSLDSKGFCTIAGLCDEVKLHNITPMVRLVPAVEIRKKIHAVKLIPTYAAPKQDSKFHPLVEIQPDLYTRRNKLESNDIYPPSDQLPTDRLAHPSVLFDRDAECAFCKAVTFYIKQDLNGDRTLENIEKVFKNVCFKWVKQYPSHCNAIISKYSLHMKHRIHDGADFEDICFFMKACPITNNKDLNVRVISSSNSSNVVCNICKEVFDEIEDVLKNPDTKKSVEKLLDQVCTNLPSSLRDECSKFIDDNLVQLLNILEQELVADNVCPALRLCPHSTSAKASSFKDVRNIECDICKDFVQQLQDKIQEPSVKATIQRLLEKGCAALPGEIADECRTYVDQNLDGLINILVQGMDPDLVCSAVGLCKTSLKSLEDPQSYSIECNFCKDVIKRVDEDLEDQRTEEEIKEALSKVCSYLPGSYSRKCKEFVNTYSALLISLLAEGLNPNEICAALKLCPESLNHLKNPANDIECELCKEIVEKLDDELKDKTTEEEIKEALEKVCTYFPASISAKCTQFIDSYAEIVINLLAQELSPSMVCGVLKICAAENLECEGCQYLLHYIQNMLMDSNVQGELKDSMKKICKILPKTYDENCEAYVDEFGSSLLAIIAQYIDPSSVCYDLNICPKNSTFLAHVNFESEKPLKMDECSMCKTAVDYLDKLLEDDDVDKEITTLVEKVCSVIPSSLKEKCTSMIEIYGPYLLQMIGQSLNSVQVCQAVDLCSRTPGHVHLLGGQKCTFGPSYWCQSKVHATACKAETFCRQKVWQN